MERTVSILFPHTGGLDNSQLSPSGMGFPSAMAVIAVFLEFLVGQTLAWASPCCTVIVRPVTPPPIVKSTPTVKPSPRVSIGAKAAGSAKANGNKEKNSGAARKQNNKKGKTPVDQNNVAGLVSKSTIAGRGAPRPAGVPTRLWPRPAQADPQSINRTTDVNGKLLAPIG